MGHYVRVHIKNSPNHYTLVDEAPSTVYSTRSTDDQKFGPFLLNIFPMSKNRQSSSKTIIIEDERNCWRLKVFKFGKVPNLDSLQLPPVEPYLYLTTWRHHITHNYIIRTFQRDDSTSRYILQKFEMLHRRVPSGHGVQLYISLFEYHPTNLVTHINHGFIKSTNFLEKSKIDFAINKGKYRRHDVH